MGRQKLAQLVTELNTESDALNDDFAAFEAQAEDSGIEITQQVEALYLGDYDSDGEHYAGDTDDPPYLSYGICRDADDGARRWGLFVTVAGQERPVDTLSRDLRIRARTKLPALAALLTQAVGDKLDTIRDARK